MPPIAPHVEAAVRTEFTGFTGFTGNRMRLSREVPSALGDFAGGRDVAASADHPCPAATVNFRWVLGSISGRGECPGSFSYSTFSLMK